MTVDEVMARVEAMRRGAGDDEGAHRDEDELWRDVLVAIAERQCDDPAALAAAALTTEESDVPRSCA